MLANGHKILHPHDGETPPTIADKISHRKELHSMVKGISSHADLLGAKVSKDEVHEKPSLLKSIEKLHKFSKKL